MYVPRAPLGCALRACVSVPAWHVPPAKRRVPLRTGLVGCAVRERLLLQHHITVRSTDRSLPVPRRLVGPQLQQPVCLQLVALRAAERPLPVS